MSGGDKLYIYTVAFNEPGFVQLQHELLKQHLQDDFVYCVVDNSSKEIACFKIKRHCKHHNAEYKRVKDNPYTGQDPSRSHAYALNHIFATVQTDPAIRYFGVLDHDIFPFQQSSVLERIKRQQAFGLRQERENSHYLWPGFMFFDKSLLNGEEIDCMPNEKGDTAAQLGQYLPASETKPSYANQQHKKLFDHGSAQADLMEVVDDSWLHLINGSNWAEIDSITEKKEMLSEILQDPARLTV